MIHRTLTFIPYIVSYHERDVRTHLNDELKESIVLHSCL